MKETAKRFLGIAVASALVIGVGAGAGAYARGGFGPGYGPGWSQHYGMMGGPGGMHGPFGGPGWMMSADPVAYADQRLSELKATLGITPEQENAWSAYATALKAKATVMASHRQAMYTVGTVGPEQRQSFYQEGLESTQQLSTAARGLVAVLVSFRQACV